MRITGVTANGEIKISIILRIVVVVCLFVCLFVVAALFFFLQVSATVNSLLHVYLIVIHYIHHEVLQNDPKYINVHYSICVFARLYTLINCVVCESKKNRKAFGDLGRG